MTSRGYAKQDSLRQSALELLVQAEAATNDFALQAKLAEEALNLSRSLQEDSLEIEARYILVKLAYYTQDSLLLAEHFQPMLKLAEIREDTAAMVRSYNALGIFYFATGESEKGYTILNIPNARNYYSAASIKENVFNLGALVDASLGYTSNLDTVYYFVNKLQQLAARFEDPSAQVVSRFKLAELLSRASDYEQARLTLRGGYPYVGKVDNKGFAHYFYRVLIDNFINSGQPDSARYYINILQEATGYQSDDPRNCYVVVSAVRASMEIGDLETLPTEFNQCFENAMTQLEKTQRASSSTLNLLFVQCTYLLMEQDWQKLEDVLSVMIKYAEIADNSFYLERAYEMKYRLLEARGRVAEALEAHKKYKEYADKQGAYVFSQSEMILQNRLRLQQSEDRNQLLEIENQNQKLRLIRSQNGMLLAVLTVLLLVMTIAYLVHLYRLRAQKNKELGVLVKERTEQIEEVNRELAKANQKLIKRNTELERFAYIVSHDLKTPLHNIIKFAGLLKSKLTGIDSNGEQEFLDFIVDGGMQMNRLIDDILEFSTYTSDSLNAETAKVNLMELAQEAEGSIAGTLDNKSGTVAVVGSLEPVYYNRAKLFVILKNLIENGLKYNESPSPKVVIQGRHEKEGYYSVFVTDNGIGIEEEFYTKVFQMFARLHSSASYKGSGLGLAICKKLVDEFQGEISVQSSPGEGASFRIDFPIEMLAKPK